MATKDGFGPDDSLPLFLSAEKPEHDIGSDRAVISRRLVTASILLATATAIGISIPSVRNPVTLVADVAASVDSSRPQPGPDESMPSIRSALIQSTADAEALQTAKEVPTSEISAPQAGPVQDARAQTQPVQYAEPPSFLERLNPFGANPPQR